MTIQARLIPIAALLACASLSAFAKGACPAPVKDAAGKAQPGSKIVSCEQETEKGKTQYEVQLKAADGKKLELDVAPDGAILQTEEKIALASVPEAVSKAFAARYAGAKAARAEKQTAADGKVTYELAWRAKGKKKEATFDAGGVFVGEE